jgi:isopenicillin N synthase-like dioxygenase
MTSVPTPKPFAFAPLTKEKLDYAPLDSISLAEPQFSSSLAHRKQLAAQVKRAASEHGFFYLTECGFSEAETMEQFAIGREFCDLPVQEKESFKINGPIGNYYGV